MGTVRRIVFALLAAVIVVGLAWALIAGLALVAAVLGPVLGITYLAWQVRTAWALWTSRGRVPIADGVRVYPAARLRALAAARALSGLGGLGLGLVPALFVFEHPLLAVVTGGAAVLLLTGAGVAGRKVLAGAQPVDLLPPHP